MHAAADQARGKDFPAYAPSMPQTEESTVGKGTMNRQNGELKKHGSTTLSSHQTVTL